MWIIDTNGSLLNTDYIEQIRLEVSGKRYVVVALMRDHTHPITLKVFDNEFDAREGLNQAKKRLDAVDLAGPGQRMGL
jgi:hypothetical protein